MASDAKDVYLTPVTSIRGVGPKLGQTLAKLDIRRVVDLILHLPYRYQDRTRIIPIGALRPGMECVVEGVIETSQIKYGRRRSLVCAISDSSGIIYLRWFYFNQAQQRRLQKGERIRCFGGVRAGRDRYEMIHPEYRVLGNDELPGIADTLTPIYSITEGIGQNKLRALIDSAFQFVREQRDIATPLERTDAFRKLADKASYPNFIESLEFVHHPPPDVDLAVMAESRHPSQKRLAFDELLAHRVHLLLAKSNLKKKSAPRLPVHTKSRSDFLAQLNFQLTRAQQRVINEIDRDLDDEEPMLRLLQGDVGSGKTAVAACACLSAIENDYQAAMMAPTELLAKQHFENFSRWFTPLGIDVVYLTGQLSTAARKDALASLTKVPRLLVIGTHALFQESVSFMRLGLIVIDEQHRFGVNQRLSLKDKVQQREPHQLIMTATPIPRTLAMSIYGDLDVSSIDELPPQRTPVNTRVLADERRDDVVTRVEAGLKEGRQVYWVCPLIEQSEVLSGEAATLTYQELSERLADYRVGLIHGRLAEKEKLDIMGKFRRGEIQLLVATTVIEVGVDVPQATLMIIENAERLGLSQLHQLRGRVGRGKGESHCVLLYQAPLGAMAKERLAIMRETNDGFKIAERDLELRGPGEVLGVKQAGRPELKISDLVRDAELHPLVTTVAEELCAQYPDVAEAHALLWLGNLMHYQQA